MDFDVLNRVGDAMKRCIIAQDTTELWEILDPRAELHGFQTSDGELVEDSCEGGASGSYASSSKGGALSPRSPRGTTTKAAAGSSAFSAVQETNAAKSATFSPDEPSSGIGSPRGGAAAGSGRVCVVKGALAVGRCTAKIFSWLQHGQSISQPQLDPQVRRRKNTTAGVSASPAAATSPVAPRRTQVPMIAESRLDLTSISSVSVTYGRPAFSLIDTLYVSEEGKVILIARALADPPTDAKQLAAYQHERASFFFKIKPTVNAPHQKPPILDYTFCGLVEATDMLRIPPATGRRHRPAPLEKTKDFDAANNEFQQSGGKSHKTLVRAKNREGREEAYEFTIEDRQLPEGMTDGTAVTSAGATGQQDPRQVEEDQMRRLAAELRGKFEAEAIRLSSNSLQDGSQIVKVVRNLVVNHYMSVSWLDLSCNQLTVVPTNLGVLPLTALYLHSNHISSWSEVEKLKELKQLTVLTLFGNGVASDTPDYKQVALAMLTNVPGKKVPLKSFDFVAVTKVDNVRTEHHLRRNQGNALPQSPRVRSTSPRR
jgi:hypothetical protein